MSEEKSIQEFSRPYGLTAEQFGLFRSILYAMENRLGVNLARFADELAVIVKNYDTYRTNMIERLQDDNARLLRVLPTPTVTLWPDPATPVKVSNEGDPLDSGYPVRVPQRFALGGGAGCGGTVSKNEPAIDPKDLAGLRDL